MASADGAKWTKDNLGTQSVDKAPFCTVPGELVPVNAPLDHDGDSFDSGSYQHETCTQNWIRLDNPLRLLVTPLWDESDVHVCIVQTQALILKFV